MLVELVRVTQMLVVVMPTLAVVQTVAMPAVEPMVATLVEEQVEVPELAAAM